ncbi:colicin immunity domain-containing protein [Nocardioides sp. KR10-350]|uniref:colicin immunity domain-containing protein n=1 Tax=Nocardioides cheoyonin TaxID=3156615 RepID=UPI0032B3789B
MEDLVAGRIEPAGFPAEYFSRYQRAPDPLPLELERVFEEVFWLAEEYVAEPELREPGDLDEKQLLCGVAEQLKRLDALG